MAIVKFLNLGRQLLSATTSGNTTSYIADGLGSIVATVNYSGAKVNDYRYKPYGSTLSKLGAGADPSYLFLGAFGYRAMSRSVAAYYGYARHYAPTLAQWTSSGTVTRAESRTWYVGIPRWVLGLSNALQLPEEAAYVYVGCNPTTYVDPKGLQGVIAPLPPRRRGFVPPDDPSWGTGAHYKEHFHKVTGFGPNFSYGSYCGAANRQNPAAGIEPQDHVDLCCKNHDRCLEANYGAGSGPVEAHLCCDSTLVKCVNKAKRKRWCDWDYPVPAGEYGQFDSNYDKRQECWHAADLIPIGIPVGTAVTVGLGGMYPPPKPVCVPENQYQHFSRINWGNPYCKQPQGRGHEYE